jgi:hypothetical protein
VAFARPLRRRRGGYDLRIGSAEREVIRDLAEQVRDMIANEDPTSDDAMARLFPAAVPDDPLQSLDFEMTSGAGLRSSKSAAAETVVRTADATRLTEDEALAWLTTLNDIRLVIGVRLGVTEESDDEDFQGEDRQRWDLYRFLTWLVASIVEVLEPR